MSNETLFLDSLVLNSKWVFARKLITLPGEDEIDLDIAGNNDDEGEEEDLTVEDGVVEVSPLDGGQTTKVEVGGFSNHHRAGQLLKEVKSWALVEFCLRMFEDSEDDGLGDGEDDGDKPGHDHHQPG